IAPTALADFDHCARRFELVHLLGLPEHARGRRSRPVGPADRAGDASLDARAPGTIAHAVPEQVPPDVFPAGGDAVTAVNKSLEVAGVGAEHPEHAAIAARALRFLTTEYARSLAERGGAVHREVAFVLPVGDERVVTLRGSMDLVVAWP